MDQSEQDRRSNVKRNPIGCITDRVLGFFKFTSSALWCVCLIVLVSISARLTLPSDDLARHALDEVGLSSCSSPNQSRHRADNIALL
jgi:hypothetical protein